MYIRIGWQPIFCTPGLRSLIEGGVISITRTIWEALIHSALSAQHQRQQNLQLSRFQAR